VNRRALRTSEIESRMHRRAAVERIVAIAEARRDHPDVGGHDLRNAAQATLERVHAREAESEPLESRVERTVARGRELLERTTLSGARSGEYRARIEAQFAQSLFGARRAAIGETRQTLGQRQL